MKKGFTIVETLVAITILIIGVLGPLALAARGISDGLFAQNQLTASLLAQEAVETMVNRRNSNIVLGGALAPFELMTGTDLGIDPKTGAITNDCNDPVYGCHLAYNETTGFYEKTSGPNVPYLFSRKIETAVSSNGNELKVTVTVKWKNKSLEQTLTTTEFLYGP